MTDWQPPPRDPQSPETCVRRIDVGVVYCGDDLNVRADKTAELTRVSNCAWIEVGVNLGVLDPVRIRLDLAQLLDWTDQVRAQIGKEATP